MPTSNQPKPSESRIAYWRRVLRPLQWWCLLVLVLYGIRLHQRWNAQTQLRFSANVAGLTSFAETDAEVDGHPYLSGQQLDIGRHILVVSRPDGYPFTTNMFVWYGAHDLGTIILERTKGTLAITCLPPARRLIIKGGEFSTELTNTTGFNSRVPTGNYQIEAIYPHWQSSDQVNISQDGFNTKTFAPRFGVVAITASHTDISFDLRDATGESIESGQLPAVIGGLPDDKSYKLTVQRKGDQKSQPVVIHYGATNQLAIEFTYGAVMIDSKPNGASVYQDRKKLGSTPLTLDEVRTGTYDFLLELDEFEPVTTTLSVTANQTNSFQTNLVSVHFTQSMASARQAFESGEFGRSVEAVTLALKYNPEDIEATNLLHKATLRDHLAKAGSLSARGDFAGAINEANLALDMEKDNPDTKIALADYTAKETQRQEAERLRREKAEADQRAQERMQELRDGFNTACRAYENAPAYANFEMIVTNSVTTMSKRISENLTAVQPAFGNVRLKFFRPYFFIVEARQMVGVGYRDCLIVGSQIRDDQVQLRYKVFEYEHLPQMNLLGGLLQVNASLTSTPQTPQQMAEHAEQYKERVLFGIKSVTGIIQQAAVQP